MSDLRKAAQAVLDRWDGPKWDWLDAGPTADLMKDLRAALAQPQGEPVIYAEGEREKEISDLQFRLDFYRRRVVALQKAQQQMRDPERVMVCDILANGSLLDPAGYRYTTPQPYIYTAPPQRKPLTNGEIYTAYIEATNQTLRAQDERLALAFARAIERAHKIGVKDE